MNQSGRRSRAPTSNSNEKAQHALRRPTQTQNFIFVQNRKKKSVFFNHFQKRSTFWGLWYLKKSSKAPPLDTFFSVI